METEFNNLHQILRTLYDEMMPLCADMCDVAKGLAGLGALFYVAHRVWQALARAEPIDIYPLLRPFTIGLCILFFPTFVLGTLNGVMSPIVTGTHSILETQTFDLDEYRAQKENLEYEAMRRNPETAWLVDDEVFNQRLKEAGILDVPQIVGMYAEWGVYNLKKSIRNGIRELLELLFLAAALVIDTIRTFFLVVLSILGPIAFAISVFDGFGSTLTAWISRYISVYLWLPVSDLFSAVLARIQVLMLKRDMEALSDPAFVPDDSSAVYIIFLCIGILGYFTVPSVAGWIIQSGGMGGAQRSLNRVAGKGAAFAGGLAGSAAGNVAGRLWQGMSNGRASSGDSGQDTSSSPCEEGRSGKNLNTTKN
jgi:conjugative transposon TraJ protein